MFVSASRNCLVYHWQFIFLVSLGTNLIKNARFPSKFWKVRAPIEVIKASSCSDSYWTFLPTVAEDKFEVKFISWGNLGQFSLLRFHWMFVSCYCGFYEKRFFWTAALRVVKLWRVLIILCFFCFQKNKLLHVTTVCLTTLVLDFRLLENWRPCVLKRLWIWSIIYDTLVLMAMVMVRLLVT